MRKYTKKRSHKRRGGNPKDLAKAEATFTTKATNIVPVNLGDKDFHKDVPQHIEYIDNDAVFAERYYSPTSIELIPEATTYKHKSLKHKITHKLKKMMGIKKPSTSQTYKDLDIKFKYNLDNILNDTCMKDETLSIMDKSILKDNEYGLSYYKYKSEIREEEKKQKEENPTQLVPQKHKKVIKLEYITFIKTILEKFCKIRNKLIENQIDKKYMYLYIAALDYYLKSNSIYDTISTETFKKEHITIMKYIDDYIKGDYTDIEMSNKNKLQYIIFTRNIIPNFTVQNMLLADAHLENRNLNNIEPLSNHVYNK